MELHELQPTRRHFTQLCISLASLDETVNTFYRTQRSSPTISKKRPDVKLTRGKTRNDNRTLSLYAACQSFHASDRIFFAHNSNASEKSNGSDWKLSAWYFSFFHYDCYPIITYSSIVHSLTSSRRKKVLRLPSSLERTNKKREEETLGSNVLRFFVNVLRRISSTDDL